MEGNKGDRYRLTFRGPPSTLLHSLQSFDQNGNSCMHVLFGTPATPRDATRFFDENPMPLLNCTVLKFTFVPQRDAKLTVIATQSFI